MTKQVIWSPAAENDLQIILDYLHLHWSSRIVFQFLNKVDDSVNLISLDYQLFPIINTHLKIRKCVVTKHNTIYYRTSKDKIEIVRLFDSRQDPEKLVFK